MASDDFTQYEYTPLENPASQIRLLEVFNDGNESNRQIGCRITTWHVDMAPTYHAMSYTWGPEEPTERVRLNDGLMTIRKNCADALRQLLHFKSSRYYWIDALCIDQTSVNEKNHQVARMGQIYSLAAHVLVCLGVHDDDAEYAFGIISQLADQYLPPTSKDSANNRIATLSISIFTKFPRIDPKRFVQSLMELTQRSYFERVWIVQELFLAKAVTMLCGQYQLPVQYPGTELILRAAAAYKVQNHDVLAKHQTRGILRNQNYSDMGWAEEMKTRNEQDGRMLRLFEQRWQNLERSGKLTFSAALQLFSSLQCQDPRDVVYGTLSLIDWEDATPIEPDYNKANRDLAAECVWRLHAQAHFASDGNQEKIARLLERMGVYAYVGEGMPRLFDHISTMRQSGENTYNVLAFRKSKTSEHYKPFIGIPMFGMPLSAVWKESQTLLLSNNGSWKDITYSAVFNTAEAPIHGDHIDVHRSDWILTSREYGDIVVQKRALTSNRQLWDVVGRGRLSSYRSTILEATTAWDWSKGQEFVLWCDPGDCTDLRQVSAWLDDRLRTFECYEQAVTCIHRDSYPPWTRDVLNKSDVE